MKMLAAVGANIAIAHKEFAVGQAGLELKRVDFGHALGADDAVDNDDGLLTCHGVVTAMKGRNMRTHFPANLIGGVVKYGFFQADPRLRQSLR